MLRHRSPPVSNLSPMRGETTLVMQASSSLTSGWRSLPSFQSPVLQIESEAENHYCNNPDGWRRPYHGYGVEAYGRLVMARVHRPRKVSADTHRKDNCRYE